MYSMLLTAASLHGLRDTADIISDRAVTVNSRLLTPQPLWRKHLHCGLGELPWYSQWCKYLVPHHWTVKNLYSVIILLHRAVFSLYRPC